MEHSISVSQIDTFSSCQYKWEVKYKRGIRVRSGEVGPMALGDVVHTALAAGLHNWFDQLKSKEVTGYEEINTVMQAAIISWADEKMPDDKRVPVITDDGTMSFDIDHDYYSEWNVMITSAYDIATRTLQNMRLVEDYTFGDFDEYPLIEHTLSVPLGGDYVFTGVVDAVLYNTVTGNYVVIDWKVRGKFTDLDSEQLNMQIGLYQHALYLQLGLYAPMGVVYQIKNSPPSKPSTNKDGSMSRRKINSDWPTYEQALLEAGLEPSEYIEEMLPKFDGVEFWRPLLVVRTLPITQKLWDNMVEYVNKINSTTIFPRAFGYACRTCPFAALCHSELYDYDTEDLMSTRYEYASWSTESEDDIDTSAAD
jgi:PD-(D/E)XK nuclease superfamily protein